MRCGVSVVLALAEIRLGAKEWLDVSGCEPSEGPKLWLVVAGKDEGLAGFEEDPACRGRTEDCVDEDLGCPEPGESIEGRASEEVY